MHALHLARSVCSEAEDIHKIVRADLSNLVWKQSTQKYPLKHKGQILLLLKFPFPLN